MEYKIRETTDNSISINPTVEGIIKRYMNELDWMLYDLAKISTGKEEYTYNTSVGSITIKIN